MRFRLDVAGHEPSPVVVVRAKSVGQGKMLALDYFRRAFYSRLRASDGMYAVNFDGEARPKEDSA